jgi:site-specific DNA-adenine methylase
VNAATPLVRWAGGKVKLVPELMTVLPGDWRERRYIDPFMGGGSLFTSMAPKWAMVGDACLPLISLYAALKEGCAQAVLRLCKAEMANRDAMLRDHDSPGLSLLGPAAFATVGGQSMPTPEGSREARFKQWWKRLTASLNSEEQRVRAMLESATGSRVPPGELQAHKLTMRVALQDAAQRGELNTLAAAFWMASESCFNGLWRVNGSGRFNVGTDPSRMNVNFMDASHFEHWARLLSPSAVSVHWGSFETLLEQAGEDDLVFADSPYTDAVIGDRVRASHTQWTAEGWSTERTEALWRQLADAAMRGAAVIHTNHDGPEIRAWAAREGFTVQAIDVKRSISCDAGTRGNIGEVICYRYPAGVSRSQPQAEQFSLFNAAG